jgi:hypothetical protein
MGEPGGEDLEQHLPRVATLNLNKYYYKPLRHTTTRPKEKGEPGVELVLQVKTYNYTTLRTILV